MTAMMIRPMDGKDLSQLRVAIIHFWLTGMRGGERVVESLCRMFPKADIYTNVVRPEALSQTLLTHPIHTTFIQKLPGSIKHYQKYFPLMPLALEQLDLRGYDLVISSESGPAKGVITRADTPHICYCHSPMRYLWDFYQDYLDSTGPATRFLMRPLFHRLRLWDYASVQRVDHIIANSRAVQRRVKRWWGRESTVIHPPVDVSAFANPDMSQLKNVLGQPGTRKLLHLSGAARQLQAGGSRGTSLHRNWTEPHCFRRRPGAEKLEKMAGPTVRFVGRAPSEAIPPFYAGCKAFLFPGEEDFGITPLEASAAGRPVIAYGKDGALDSIIPDETGLFFEQQNTDSLIATLNSFETTGDTAWNVDTLKAHAQGFSEVLFRDRMETYLQKVVVESYS